MAPCYICDLFRPRKKTSTRSSVRSSDPRAKSKTFGDCTFAFAGLSKWNRLPLTVRMTPNYYLLDSCKKHLKTFFSQKSILKLLTPGFLFIIFVNILFNRLFIYLFYFSAIIIICFTLFSNVFSFFIVKRFWTFDRKSTKQVDSN